MATKKKTAAKPATPHDIVDGNVTEAKAAITDLDTDELNQVRALETGGDNRTSLVKAVDEELAARDNGRAARMATMEPPSRAKRVGQVETASGD